MKLPDRRILACMAFGIIAFGIGGCAASKSAKGVTIFHNEIPLQKTIADALSGNRVMILKPLILVRDLPPSLDNANADPRETESSPDRMADRTRNTFDSTLRFTILDQSASRAVQTPQMPIDSMRAYDSIQALGSAGFFDLAVIPDEIEIAPGRVRVHDSNDLSGETEGIRPDDPGSMGGAPPPPRQRSRSRGIESSGHAVSITCHFTIVRGSDRKTIFSGEFTNPSVEMGGRGALAGAMKGLCEQFIHWKSE